MIIICIDNTYGINMHKRIMLEKSKGSSMVDLTIGKQYEVVSQNEASYFVKNDNDRVTNYFKDRFSRIEEYRDTNLDKLLK